MEKTEELRLNHKLILELFDKFNMLLSDNNIDHYYTSGILPYVLTGHSLVRYHHDLDVFINMDDLERLENICEDYNFIFRRQLGDRDDGTERRTLKTYYKGLDIPITLFMFVREKDGSITQKDYYFTENGELFVEDIFNSKKCAELSFSEEMYYHNNIPYKSISIEALYLSKISMNRPKDIEDCKIMKEYVNFDKLNTLIEEYKMNKENESYKVINSGEINFILDFNKQKIMERV